MDINQQVTPAPPPIQPIPWTWIVQRQPTDGKADSIWKFGFIAPDGAEVRVTFHQIGTGAGTDDTTPQADPMTGMPPMPAPDSFAPPGVPQTDQTQDSTFYVTFFSNRHPEYFMKWDTSISHEQSLATWITITHGIVDFVRKANPQTIILDDLANGKLKMVLRSVAMDVVGSNPEYALEQTQKHHYRSFFQIKKASGGTAFQTVVQDRGHEGETVQPQIGVPPETQGDPQTNAAMQPPEQSNAMQTPGASGMGDKSGDHTLVPPDKMPAIGKGTDEHPPAFPSANPAPIKQTASLTRGMTVEIGKDYSVAVKDKDGNAVDRYRGKNPADLLRWISDKGYSANRMVIVDREMPSKSVVQKVILARTPATDSTVKPVIGSTGVTQESVDQTYRIIENRVQMHKVVTAQEAAAMNTIINAEQIISEETDTYFVFETDRDMSFKKALVEIAFKRVMG